VKRGLRTAWTVARRELLTLVDQPTGYILLVVFVAVNDFLCFRQIELYGVATLRPMLDFLPWLLLFLVPAVTMRALAEDARSGTLEVVLAQPVTELELVLGKYSARCCSCGSRSGSPFPSRSGSPWARRCSRGSCSRSTWARRCSPRASPASGCGPRA